MSQETEASEVEVEQMTEQTILLEAEMDRLDAESQEEINRLEAELTATTADNQALNAEIIRMEEQIEQINRQQTKINQGIMEWMSRVELVDEQIITQDMIEELFDEEQSKQRLYELEFIANQFYFIEITVITKQQHEVYINGQETNIYLDSSVYEDEEKLLNSREALFDRIELEMKDIENGYNNILFTLKDDGTTLNKAFDMIWDVIKSVEDKYGTDEIYKIQYLAY